MTSERRVWIRLVGGSLAVLTLIGGASAARTVAAEEHGRHEVERWRHGEIGRFHEHDLARWHTGRWVHGEHVGRVGWWWVVDGTWFSYPAPIYPYPDPYMPSMIAGTPSSPPAYWYYCPSAQAYYPYVTACPEGWTPVVPEPSS